MPIREIRVNTSGTQFENVTRAGLLLLIYGVESIKLSVNNLHEVQITTLDIKDDVANDLIEELRKKGLRPQTNTLK